MPQAKVLVVEDDAFLSELLGTKLKKEGFEVTLAGDGETALVKMKEVKPDVILLDLMLPKMDGFQVMESIKRDEDKSLMSIPIIILSNFGQEEKIQKGLQLGAKDYLVKANFTTSEIVDKIRKTIKL